VAWLRSMLRAHRSVERVAHEQTRTRADEDRSREAQDATPPDAENYKEQSDRDNQDVGGLASFLGDRSHPRRDLGRMAAPDGELSEEPRDGTDRKGRRAEAKHDRKQPLDPGSYRDTPRLT
jgi:hypothetical protein